MASVAIMRIDELPTPALLVERAVLDPNLDTMSAALPGRPAAPAREGAQDARALARRQRAHGHPGFTCATIREMRGHGRGRAR